MRKYEYDQHGRLVEAEHTQNIYVCRQDNFPRCRLQGVYFDVVNGRLSYMKQCQDVAVQLWSNLA
jgi:hypothetical protein